MRPVPRLPFVGLTLALAASLLAACGGASSIKPAELLDERTGMTVGALDKPIEMVQGFPALAMAASDRRVSFAYLGPVEWDNMGDITYALWIHIAPANDWRFDDIRVPGTVKLLLDDTAITLAVMQPPALARAPYQQVASWGETAYFGVDLDTLRRMAASGRIGLEARAGDSAVHFAAGSDTHETLERFLHARGY